MTSQSPSEVVGPVVVAISRLANRRNLRLRSWRKVLLRDPCAYCGGPGGTIDHITPRRDQGPARTQFERRGVPYPNAAPACESCNVRKGHESLLGFLKSRMVAT